MNNLSRLIFLCVLSASRLSGESFEMHLWEGGAPGSERSTLEETIRIDHTKVGDDRIVSRWVENVSDPTITVWLPEEENRTGVAVLICPGGGFVGQELDMEGTEIAELLNEHGVAGIVLKYRLPDPSSGIYVYNGSILDAQRAIRIIRHHAEKWEIDRDKIGVAGFSAGGYLAAATGTMFDYGNPESSDPVERLSSRPSFISPVYPLISLKVLNDRQMGVIQSVLGPDATEVQIDAYSLDEQVTAETPPTFLIHAHDDHLSSENSVRFYAALKQFGVPVELHVFARGGHGFGIRSDRPGIIARKWPELWLDWMQDSGFLLAEN